MFSKKVQIHKDFMKAMAAIDKRRIGREAAVSVSRRMSHSAAGNATRSKSPSSGRLRIGPATSSSARTARTRWSRLPASEVTTFPLFGHYVRNSREARERPFAVRTPSTNPTAAVTVANRNARTAYSGGRSACSELLINQAIVHAHRGGTGSVKPGPGGHRIGIPYDEYYG